MNKAEKGRHCENVHTPTAKGLYYQASIFEQNLKSCAGVLGMTQFCVHHHQTYMGLLCTLESVQELLSVTFTCNPA